MQCQSLIGDNSMDQRISHFCAPLWRPLQTLIQDWQLTNGKEDRADEDDGLGRKAPQSKKLPNACPEGKLFRYGGLQKTR
jgi:hypothetical protein